MKKIIYVIDTSVIISNPNFLNDFSDTEIIFPIAVITELDKLKKFPNETGKSARVFIRKLDEISESSNFSVGVKYKGLLIKIDTSSYSNNVGDKSYGDNEILSCCIELFKKHKNNLCLLSNDFNLRIRARASGINAKKHDSTTTSVNELYSGFRTINNELAVEELLFNGEIECKKFGIKEELNPNEFVVFKDDSGETLACGKHFAGYLNGIKPVYPWDLNAKNREQSIAINLLMDEKIKLVSITGPAGTGKTLISLATALELVLNKRAYEKVLVYKPTEAVGKDVGYLPGLLEEKLAPYFQNINDNLEHLFKSNGDDKWKANLDMYKKKGKISFEALTYIRGRSINNAIMIVDEAQNLSPEVIRTVLTRAGNNTKIILLGDISQIDNQDLDPTNNGLTYVVEKFKVSELSGHITLVKGERSALAEEATKLL